MTKEQIQETLKAQIAEKKHKRAGDMWSKVFDAQKGEFGAGNIAWKKKKMEKRGKRKFGARRRR